MIPTRVTTEGHKDDIRSSFRRSRKYPTIPHSEPERSEFIEAVERLKSRRNRHLESSESLDVNLFRSSPTSVMRLRMKKVSQHFRHKAGAVLGDGGALRLLADLYEGGAIDKEAMGLCRRCSSLAKLTAANFCEVGVNVVYITPAGRRFIDRIEVA